MSITEGKQPGEAVGWESRQMPEPQTYSRMLDIERLIQSLSPSDRVELLRTIKYTWCPYCGHGINAGNRCVNCDRAP